MDYRSEFFDFEGVAYLNCANQGAFPRETAEAIEEAIGLKTRPDRIRDDIYFRVPNEIRAELAALFGGAAADYAVTNGASDGIFAVSRGMNWRDGDEVLVATGDFPANFFSWGTLKRRGVGLRVVPAEDGIVTTERFIEAMTTNTRIACLSLVSYTTGYRIDAETLAAACRRNHTLLILDITQAAGAVPLDVVRLGADVSVCAGYKWLLSPYGTGFAWFQPAALPKIAVTDVYWQAVEGAENFNRLPGEGWKLAPGARRFDSTETASYLNGYAMRASLRFLKRVGVEAIHRHVTALLDHLVAGLPHDFRAASSLAAPRRSTVLAIAGENPEATRHAYEALLARKVVVSLRDDKIRFSPHLYNTEADIERALAVLASL